MSRHCLIAAYDRGSENDTDAVADSGSGSGSGRGTGTGSGRRFRTVQPVVQ